MRSTPQNIEQKAYLLVHCIRMKILAIESSCDETAIALLERKGDGVYVEKNSVYSQVATHAEFGGVVPEVAARLHVEKILPMLAKDVPHNGEGIDAIAVTAGPGLAPALRVGVETAKTLAWAWNKPLIPISHLEGHIYANWLVTPGAQEQKTALENFTPPTLPALALVVSGGHTELIMMRAHGDFERIGETLDDAAGEAFDKVANMLKLGYPGGPKVSALAKEGDAAAYNFPRAMLDRDNFDMSFSGLKTSVLYTLRSNDDKLEDDQFKKDICASFEQAVVDVLVKKTIKAAKKFQPKTVLLAGGVAANSALRERLAEEVQKLGIAFIPPERAYTMDNAAMIGAAAAFRADQKNITANPLTLEVNTNLDSFNTYES